jgi:hypothetical protein
MDPYNWANYDIMKTTLEHIPGTGRDDVRDVGGGSWSPES